MVDNTQVSIQLTEDQIDVDRLWHVIADSECGAHNVFVGKTRRTTAGRETSFLVYQAYSQMAVVELRRIAEEAFEKWSLRHLIIVHRTGRVELGEPSVAIGASAAHRGEVFESTAWVLDALKNRVPIWKQENWSDGETQWVHP